MYRNYLLSQLLECGFMDVDFLEWLIKEFDIEIDIDEIKQEFWTTNINILIYKVFNEIKDKFLEEYREEVEKIVWNNIDDFDDEDYEIFTNCIDSHLRFYNEEVEALFQEWQSKNYNNN